MKEVLTDYSKSIYEYNMQYTRTTREGYSQTSFV